ncbi:hypothetical protein AZE42_12630 [Rhizopogon vesiculosus]|uniref:Uncharacterized protein n=1 Tax=Rhizopogon vesiculosus TaxID=180088 RepID=A0A1J8PFA9_9AGAM|nr:hypothetical protein AZE42_12630 [Rhizopogon vesiculosus]
MNARYYLRPNDTEHVNISEFRAHRPSLQTSRDSKAEDLQESRMNVFKHPQDDEGFQVVKVVTAADCGDDRHEFFIISVIR